jgi:hypothetical protein
MDNRDNFSNESKRILQERVGNRCSNPDCQCLTSGPNADPQKATRIGVAAHITAASPGGPRWNPALTNQQRSSITNAIWLCQNCAKLVDSDSTIYPEERLFAWREFAEENCRRILEGKEPFEVDNPNDEIIWSCGWCRSAVPDGQLVCATCNSEAAYGATRQERAQAGQAGLYLGFLAYMGIILLIPNWLNSSYEMDIPLGLGLGIYNIPLAFIVSLASSYLNVELEEKKHRGKPPRFFRNTSI